MHHGFNRYFFECKCSKFIGEEGRTTTANVNTHEFRNGDEGGGKELNALLKQQSKEIKERMKEQGVLLHVRHGNQVYSPLQLESLPWVIVYL